MKGKKGCAPGVQGLGKKPSKTSKKMKKTFPFFNHSTPPSNTPGSDQPGPSV